VHVNEGGTFF